MTNPMDALLKGKDPLFPDARPGDMAATGLNYFAGMDDNLIHRSILVPLGNSGLSSGQWSGGRWIPAPEKEWK